MVSSQVFMDYCIQEPTNRPLAVCLGNTGVGAQLKADDMGFAERTLGAAM